MDSEQLEVIQLLDRDIDLLKKGIREERYKLPDVIKNSFSDAQIADPNMLDLFVDLLQLSQQHLNAPQSRAASRDKSLQTWPVLEVVPDTRPSPLLVQCRHCGRMLRAEVFHDHVTGCQQSRGESRGNVNRTRDNSPAPRQEDSEDSVEERSRDHVTDRASQDLTRDMSQVARDLSPLARELVKKIGAEHSKRKRDDTEDEGPKSKKRKLSNEPATLPKKEIATTIEVTPPVTHQPMSIVDTWTAEEHDDRTTLKKLLMSKNSNQSSEEHVKELLEFIKSVPPRPLVFTNDDDALYFWHQSRTQSMLPVATRATRDRRAHRLRGAGVTVQALPSSELTHSVYRYTVPNRQLKLTAQQVLLQQTVKIALLSGLLHQNDPNTGNKQLRSSKGRVRANNSTTPTPPPSAATTPSTEKKSESVESEVDEKQLMAKLLQLEPNTTAANNSTVASANNSINTSASTSSVPPTANNSNNVTAVSTPVPVTTAPSTSIAVPATPVPTAVTAVTPTPTAVAKTGHVPTLLVPNSALSATLKDMAMKSKTGPGVPLTAVTLLHPTQLQGANIKMQVKQGVDKSKQGKVPPLAQPKTAPPPTGVKATPAPVSVTPKQISPKPAVKQPPLLAKPVLDSALLTANRVVLPLTSANASLMRGANTNMAGRVVSSMPVVLTTAAKPLVAPPNAVVPPTVPAKKSTAKK